MDKPKKIQALGQEYEIISKPTPLIDIYLPKDFPKLSVEEKELIVIAANHAAKQIIDLGEEYKSSDPNIIWVRFPNVDWQALKALVERGGVRCGTK